MGKKPDERPPDPEDDKKERTYFTVGITVLLIIAFLLYLLFTR